MRMNPVFIKCLEPCTTGGYWTVFINHDCMCLLKRVVSLRPCCKTQAGGIHGRYCTRHPRPTVLRGGYVIDYFVPFRGTNNKLYEWRLLPPFITASTKVCSFQVKPVQTKLSKMFMVESSGKIKQGSRWILMKFERPSQRSFECWIVECGQEGKRADSCSMG